MMQAGTEMLHLGSIVHGSVFMVVTTIVTCMGAVLLKLWHLQRRGYGTSRAGWVDGSPERPGVQQ